MYNKNKKILFKLVIAISLFVIWYILSRESNPLFLPSPEKIFDTSYKLLMNGMLLKAIVYSFTRITIATFLASLISFILAILIVLFKPLDDLLYPIISKFRYFPLTAFYPLFILWMGIGEVMKISFLFAVTATYFLPSIVLTIKDIDSRLIDTGLTLGMSKFQILNKIIIPYSLPEIFESILLMYGIGWTYISIAELVDAKYGLGFLINLGSSRGHTDQVFMSIILIMLISFLVDTVGNKIIQKKFTWKFKTQRRN